MRAIFESTVPRGLELVAPRRLVVPGPLVTFELLPGDRPLVAAGDAVSRGGGLVERLRDPHSVVLRSQPDADARSGDRFAPGASRLTSLRGRADPHEVELLHHAPAGWRGIAGEVADTIEAPMAGIVRELRRGVGLTIAFEGHALCGSFVIGGPSSGRLAVAADPAGELASNALDVGLAGSIVVAGSRIAAETISRARAMGIRGIVVAALGQKELRDLRASEARQRAALHRLEPFAVLVLDGTVRRPIAGPLMAILAALAGRDVAIVDDPPALLFEAPDAAALRPHEAHVRIRHGELIGREGRYAGAVGRRRFAANVHADAAAVTLSDGRSTVVPLADLERYV
jgi:hypothetical protein